MSEIDTRRDALVVPGTGEVFDLANDDNAADAYAALKVAQADLNSRFAELLGAVRDRLLEVRTLRGDKKTMHFERVTLVISGGPTEVYPPDTHKALHDDMVAADLPRDRLAALIKVEHVTTVNRTVANDLKAANPKYAEILARYASAEVEPWRISVKSAGRP